LPGARGGRGWQDRRGDPELENQEALLRGAHARVTGHESGGQSNDSDWLLAEVRRIARHAAAEGKGQA